MCLQVFKVGSLSTRPHLWSILCQSPSRKYPGRIQNIFMVCCFIEFIVSSQAEKYELAPTQKISLSNCFVVKKNKLLVHSHPCSKALGPTRPPAKWVTWFFHGVRLPKNGSAHPPSFSSEVKKEQGYTMNPLLCLHGFRPSPSPA